jgi:nitrate reductase alpha subunit
MEGRTPYIQVLDQAVPPLGESVDDWEAMLRIARAVSSKARERNLPPVKDVVFGKPIAHDYQKLDEIFTLNGSIKSTKDIANFLLANSAGYPQVTYDELAKKGFVRVNDSADTQFGPASPYSYKTLASVRDKKPWATLTGRQQFYMDHDWFLAEGEQLPVHVDPLAVKGYPLRLTMGHARHGIHSMWRDDQLLLSLQRGQPDVYVNPDDAQARGVQDGDMIRTFNTLGSFVAMAHVSSSMQPGQMFMYHGWDPMMFKGRQNFSGAIPTAGLLKPTSLVGDYGHIGYKTPDYVPNQTYHDHTVDFEKYVPAAADAAAPPVASHA